MLVPIDDAEQACAEMPCCGFDDGVAQTGPRVELVQDEALIGGLRRLAIGVGSAVYDATLECRDQRHGRGIHLQDRDQQIGHRQEGGEQWRRARRSVHNQANVRICQHIVDRTVQQRRALRNGRSECHRTWHVGEAVREERNARGGRAQRFAPIRFLKQPMGEARPVAQRDAEMQPKAVLRIEIKCDHLAASSRYAVGNVGSKCGFADTPFG